MFRSGALSAWVILGLLGWLVPARASAAQERSGVGPQPTKGGEWTADDILLAESVSEFRISPDGRWVVWVKSQMDRGKGEQISNLYLSSLTERREIQLTRGQHVHTRPRWSPGGTLIAFLGTRPLPQDGEQGEEGEEGGEGEGKPAKTQLWLMNPFGGEPWPVTESKRDIRAYEWKSDDAILFIAQEDPSLYEQERRKRKDTSRVVDDSIHEPPVRLFMLAVKDRKVTRVLENEDWIDALAVSPDGRKVVTVHQRSLSWEFDQRVPSVTFLTDLETGSSRQIFDGSRIIPQDVRWARHGRGFYFVNDSTTHPRYRTATIRTLWYYDLARGEATLVNLGWDRGHGSDYGVTPDGFLALLADGVRYRPARYVQKGAAWTRRWVEGGHSRNLLGLEIGADGRTAVYLHSTANTPPQLYRATIRGSRLVNEQVLTDLNPGFKDKPKPRVEVVRWKGARDEEVEGIVYYPLGYTAGKRYPLIVSVHGGPAAADLDAWSQGWSRPDILLNQRGAFVFKVNYHGSSHYGLEWVESICCGNYYDLEIPDIERGVDDLIGRGLADPDRLGVMGWSNGSILSIELTTRNPRFRAASAGAGDVEWVSDWANVDFGAAFDNYYFGAAPYENPELYIRKSPFFRMKDVKTPTIIYFGTEDRNVPTDQGWSHYRALQQIGETPVRFILFPGEAHGLTKLGHQRRKVEEDLAWFDRHLFGTHAPANEALKEGSPLAQALKRTGVQKVDGRYGVAVNGILVPEVVPFEGLAIGRFEVTRAQYAAFDRGYVFERGTENYPASGITFEQAKAYVAWLSGVTGAVYRLGREDEMQAICEAATGGENTLDYWAGYAPNPDDARRLADKIRELPGAAPLLREVGSFAGRGTGELVFDLGGNVAEWVGTSDGAGRLMGGSADRAGDPKVGRLEAAPAYRGFRVILAQERALPPSDVEAAARLRSSPRHGEWVWVKTEEGDSMSAWLVYPERKEKTPVVVVIHEIFGLTDWIRGVADQLAAEGFLAIAPDLLSGKGRAGGGTESLSRDEAIRLVRSLTPEAVVARVNAAAKYATSLPAATKRYATIGFCWGGSMSFHYATADPDLSAAIIYYGASPATERLARVRASVLGLYAGDDARVNATIPPAEAEMKRLGKGYEYGMYDGAGHGFLRAQGEREGANLRASEKAWPRTVEFLRKTLGS